jgi:hypothetical protein
MKVIAEQSACQVADRDHDSVPDDTSPNAEADLMPTFVDSMRIFPCPEVAVVDVEHTFTRERHLVCPQEDLIRGVLMS